MSLNYRKENDIAQPSPETAPARKGIVHSAEQRGSCIVWLHGSKQRSVDGQVVLLGPEREFRIRYRPVEPKPEMRRQAGVIANSGTARQLPVEANVLTARWQQ